MDQEFIIIGIFKIIYQTLHYLIEVLKMVEDFLITTVTIKNHTVQKETKECQTQSPTLNLPKH